MGISDSYVKLAILGARVFELSDTFLSGVATASRASKLYSSVCTLTLRAIAGLPDRSTPIVTVAQPGARCFPGREN
jgi:hypothetical protein